MMNLRGKSPLFRASRALLAASLVSVVAACGPSNAVTNTDQNLIQPPVQPPQATFEDFSAALYDPAGKKVELLNVKGEVAYTYENVPAKDVVKLASKVAMLVKTDDNKVHFVGINGTEVVPSVDVATVDASTPAKEPKVSKTMVAYLEKGTPSKLHVFDVQGTKLVDGAEADDFYLSDELVAYVHGTDLTVLDSAKNAVVPTTALKAAKSVKLAGNKVAYVPATAANDFSWTIKTLNGPEYSGRNSVVEFGTFHLGSDFILVDKKKAAASINHALAIIDSSGNIVNDSAGKKALYSVTVATSETLVGNIFGRTDLDTAGKLQCSAKLGLEEILSKTECQPNTLQISANFVAFQNAANELVVFSAAAKENIFAGVAGTYEISSQVGFYETASEKVVFSTSNKELKKVPATTEIVLAQ